MSVATRPVLAAAGGATGATLGRAFGLLARVRGTRALHPVGVCGRGWLLVSPGPPSGVHLLDEPGPHPCLVRSSRATGLRRWPDVEGLAVRVEGPGAGDVLLASTGTGVVGRHLLTLRGPGAHGTVTTLLPMSTARGPLLLRLDPEPAEAGAGRVSGPPRTWRLLVAAPGQPWHERGRLEVVWEDGDCHRRHDPVRHPPTGTWMHPLWSRLRAPSYVRSEEVAASP
ncbi:phosphodiesterase [Ornithinimicrobium avium]|uniref:Phosphodiesterase n=1 Tax=Ornithinimicrobium avium TaxID=2283195 RepID=A0A345NPE9_9MICO|nr:phosphodiesterase [Ornithinimicrobium avium]AXH96907.1 phosphodiesterase [Ornithinimicrobium avium]